MISLSLFSIMESENEKRKDGIYNTWLFSVYHVFILQKKKTKMGTTDHISIFRFLFDDYKKGKGCFFYSLSIFYYEIEKTKNERTVYTRIGSALYTRCGPLSFVVYYLD